MNTKDFIHALFEPEDLVEYRLLYPGGRVDRIYSPAADIEVTAGELRKANDAGANVYFGAHPRAGKDGTAAGVKSAQVFFADFDNVAEETTVMAKLEVGGIPEPTVVVSTGGGFHCWWRLDRPLDVDRWRLFERAIVHKSGADPAVKDVARIMRLPGYVNTKPNRGQVAEVTSFSKVVYPTGSIGSLFPSAKPTDRLPRPLGVEIPDGILAKPYGWCGRELIEMGRWPLTKENERKPRRETLFEIACDMAARGWDFAEARDVLMAAARKLPSGVSQLTARELDDIPRQIANAFKQPREPELWEQERGLYSIWLKKAAKHIERVKAESEEPEQVVDESAVDVARKIVSLGEAFNLWLDGEEIQYVKTGIDALDHHLGGGLAKKEMVGLGGIPGCGKSALAMQIAVNAAAAGRRVLWMWGEMNVPRLFARAATVWWHSQGTGPRITIGDFSNNRTEATVHGAAAQATRAIGDSIHFLSGEETLEELSASVELIRPDLVVIDYLQLLNPTVSLRGASQNDRLTEVSKTLRRITVGQDVATLVVMSSSKAIGGDPEVGDVCRGSGQVDYDLDGIVFGTRPKPEKPRRGEPEPEPDNLPAGHHRTIWRVKKSRNGDPGDVHGIFKGSVQFFGEEDFRGPESSEPEVAFEAFTGDWE